MKSERLIVEIKTWDSFLVVALHTRDGKNLAIQAKLILLSAVFILTAFKEQYVL
jgi:hypothetical protein